MKLSMSKTGTNIPRENNYCMAQVGWLGQTGGVYPLDKAPNIKQEPGSYAPIYMQVGTWSYDIKTSWFGLKKEKVWYLEQD